VSGLAQPTAWRLMLAAFALWAANFFVGYAAVLLALDDVATRLLIAAMALGSLVALALLARRGSTVAEGSLVRASLLVASLAILFNGVTALA
jgi:hypothetical protein